MAQDLESSSMKPSPGKATVGLLKSYSPPFVFSTKKKKRNSSKK